MRTFSPAALISCAIALSPLGHLAAQGISSAAAPDSSRPAPTAAQPALPFDFSGVLYTNYQYGGIKGNRTQNRFELERAYLTFRGTAGDRVSYRVTADVFQQRDTTKDQYYRGWTFRAKYAYGQYDFLRDTAHGIKASARLGMLPTVVIDVEEQYWQRGLSQVALEQSGFFSSSDLGAAAVVTLPNKLGEAYAVITNGNGYASRETDRFKDYAARLTLTPLAGSDGPLKGVSITPWYSKGSRASDFTARRGTVLPVTEGRQRDRYGVLVAYKDPRLTLGAHTAWRVDDVERADTTRDLAPTVASRTGRTVSLFSIVKPLAYVPGAPALPLAVVLRADDIKPDTDGSQEQRFYIAGLQWELSKRASITFDYQNQVPRNGSTAPDLKTFFVHAILSFP